MSATPLKSLTFLRRRGLGLHPGNCGGNACSCQGGVAGMVCRCFRGENDSQKKGLEGFSCKQ